METSLYYHEAGHAVVAVWLGGELLSLTVEPDNDDGPRRDGDASIRWHHRGLTKKDLCQRELMTVLAGPVAEMIHTEQERPLHSHPQWAADWQIAWELASQVCPHPTARMELLQRIAAKLFVLLENDDCWQAVSEVADLLDAFETLDGEQVAECVHRWMPPYPNSR